MNPNHFQSVSMMCSYREDYCVFDIETTGLSSDDDAIIEISAIKVENGKTIDEFSTLINPQIHIPYSASSINGITDEMVKCLPTVDEALSNFLSFIGDRMSIRSFLFEYTRQKPSYDEFKSTKKNPKNDSGSSMFMDFMNVSNRHPKAISESGKTHYHTGFPASISL